MLRVVVMVSGGGTNLQAILDAVDAGRITNTEIVGVISNNKNAYALTRAAEHGIKAECISPKDYESRAEFRFLSAGSGRTGRLPGGDPSGNDRKIQKPDDQYSSFPDPGFLRNRILRTESA